MSNIQKRISCLGYIDWTSRALQVTERENVEITGTFTPTHRGIAKLD